MKLDRRLLRQALTAPARQSLLIGVGLGLLAGLALAGQARLLGRALGQAFLGGQPLARVWPLLAALAGLAVLRAALGWAAEVAAQRAAARVKSDLRGRLLAHLTALGPMVTRGERSGELANTAVDGIETLDPYVRHYLPQLALAVLLPAAYLALVFPLDWISGLILLLTAPLIPVFMALIGGQAEALTRRRWTTLSRLSAHFLDVIQGLPALKLLGRSVGHVTVVARIGERYRQATMQVLRVTFLSALVLEMVAAISTAVIAVEVALRLMAGGMGLEQALFVLILAPEFYLPLRQLGARFHAAMPGAAAAQRIWEVLDKPVADVDELEPGVTQSTVVDAGAKPGAIRFRGVRYTYPGGERPALDGVSFDVAAGETVALVGPSGAGKSTAAALLLGFARPDEGEIAVDGRRLKATPAGTWRAPMAWVPQQPTLFRGTIADNIRLGRPEASDEQVAEAARQAQAHELVAALPRGYATRVGERGARLSGGEAQRIALARAFLKDAPLIVLDEATANLDPETAALVAAATRSLLEHRTGLVIAHRLETVRLAHRIVVLNAGRAVETGTHAELVARGGLYARLVAAAGRGEQAPVDHAPDRCGSAAGEGDPAPGQSPGKVETGTRPQRTYLSRGQHGQRAEKKSERRGPGGWLLALMAPFSGWMTLATLLGAATIGSSVGLMAGAAYLISRSALRPPIAELSVAIVAVRFFGIARGLFRYGERLVSHEVTFRLLARLRARVYAALEPLAPARLIHAAGGDLQARIVTDVESLDTLYLRAIFPPAVALLLVAGLALWLGRLSPVLAWTLAGWQMAAGLAVPARAWWAGRGPGRELIRLRGALSAAVVDGVQGMAELLAFGQAERHRDQIAALDARLAALQARMARIEGGHQAASGLLAALATAAMVALAVPLVSAGRLDGVMLAVVALAALASFEALLPLPAAFQNLESSLEAGRRLVEIADVRPAVTDPPRPAAPPAPGSGPGPAGVDLQIDDLSFSYGPGQPPALDGLCLSLPPGGTVALVGPSGAGKTTLANLLVRFWEYEVGHIRLGGRELRDYRQEEARQLIAVVSQRPHLFNATIADNLRLARPEATQTEMIEACRAAHIHEFIALLPEGYETWIGEQGLRLSAGQRQRLAVARALLQRAPLLILDEPTANLDALAEQDVMAVLTNRAGSPPAPLRPGWQSTLIITHRLAGLEAADEIVVLRGGRVAERGRHAELLERGGLYRRMWDAQSAVLGGL